MPLIGSDRSPAQAWTNHHGYWGQLLHSPPPSYLLEAQGLLVLQRDMRRMEVGQQRQCTIDCGELGEMSPPRAGLSGWIWPWLLCFVQPGEASAETHVLHLISCACPPSWATDAAAT